MDIFWIPDSSTDFVAVFQKLCADVAANEARDAGDAYFDVLFIFGDEVGATFWVLPEDLVH